MAAKSTKKSSPSAGALSASDEVESFLAKLKHPLKREILTVRSIRVSIVWRAGLVFLSACAPRPASDVRSPDASTSAEIRATGLGEVMDRNVTRIRAATAAFKSLDEAAAAGYALDAVHFVDNAPVGAMGYHHQNDALLDDRIELERPEMLVYERLPNGEYRLNGVEYIVPLSAWTSEKPPTVMGQALKRAPSLGIWYRHVWVWRDNPSGLFADWNPLVKC